MLPNILLITVAVAEPPTPRLGAPILPNTKI